MQGNPIITRGGLLILIAFGALIIFSTRLFQSSDHESASVAPSSNISNIAIMFPTATNLCVDGCSGHENWITFYLQSSTYAKKSLRLKTSLFWGQILTYGTSGEPCPKQDKTSYVCINMGVSHRLLELLTRSGLTPLDQLRNTNNWWLEYTFSNPINQ